jgi:hypothetical protein
MEYLAARADVPADAATHDAHLAIGAFRLERRPGLHRAVFPDGRATAWQCGFNGPDTLDVAVRDAVRSIGRRPAACARRSQWSPMVAFVQWRRQLCDRRLKTPSCLSSPIKTAWRERWRRVRRVSTVDQGEVQAEQHSSMEGA